VTDVIRIKRRALGGAAGAPSSLAIGELAYNEVDGGLYIGLSNGTIVQVNLAGGGGGSETTGDAKLTFKTAADAGWVFMDDGTIGDASSGATTRANADTSSLFSLFWTNIVYPYQFNCTITIASPAVITATAHNFSVGQRVRFTTTGVLPTPLTVGTDYFIISTGFGANAFRISTTYGGAAVNTSGSQSGSHIVVGYFELLMQDNTGAAIGKGLTAAADFAAHKRLPLPKQLGRSIVAAGSGAGLTQRFLGFNAGEESHAQSLAEMVAHSHTVNHNAMTWSGQIFSDSVDSYIVPTNPNTATISTTNTGSGAAANVMQPSTFWNIMIKL